MKRCKNCRRELEEDFLYCPVCGEKLEETGVGCGESSIFVKYKDFLDNETLYRTACAKRNGILQESFSGEGEEIIRLLAERGHAESMYQYADILTKKDSFEVKEVYQWLKLAAQSGHEASRLRLQTDPLFAENAEEGSVKKAVLDGDENFESLVDDSLPAVLSIISVKTSGERKASAGSGFIVEGGYVVTNAHVIESKTDLIVAKFEERVDQFSYNLVPLVIDRGVDVAILKFQGLAAKKVAERRQLQLRLQDVGYGERVYTIGNPLGLGLSVSQGIISCPKRKSNYPSDVDWVIQTDITINHGNSGGALFDGMNNVIGIITFVPGGSEGGIGMCVPAQYIVKALNKVK